MLNELYFFDDLTEQAGAVLTFDLYLARAHLNFSQFTSYYD
jgi:hypothetical protein